MQSLAKLGKSALTLPLDPKCCQCYSVEAELPSSLQILVFDGFFKFFEILGFRLSEN